jgi:hypothetical protein
MKLKPLLVRKLKLKLLPALKLTRKLKLLLVRKLKRKLLPAAS